MDDIERSADGAAHSHVFLGAGHEASERKTWIVIGVCAAMMVLEIGGGALFGSIALVADGLHMSTHAGAMLLAALAYTFARKHASDPRFSFGTGKFGDLAGFASAIVLAMIALLIGYEAVGRLLAPWPIDFPEAIAIATLGLGVNVFTAWILSGGDHHHDHGHGHSHGHGGHGEDGHDDEVKEIATPSGALLLEIHEADAPPRFRLRAADGRALDPSAFLVETIRPNGARQSFAMRGGPDFIESVDVIPEPHAFVVEVGAGGEVAVVEFEEHEHAHGQSARDNNMRAALVHIVADAAVSALVIAGLLLARAFGWLWIDPLVGFAGAIVVGSWALGLLRDTGAILLDMVPDAGMRGKIRDAVEIDGDRVVDLHLWRLGPGHLGGIVAVATRSTRDAAHYRARLARFRALSHVTVEVRPA
jgi:cation diffusion facilitator family transporter